MTDYIIIGLLVVNLICLLIFLSKNNNKNNNEMIEKLGKFETDITKSIGDFKFDFSKVNQEQLVFFKGWFIDNTKNHIFVDFIKFYEVFGEKITNDYFRKIELFVVSKGVKTFFNNRVLVCTMLNFLASKGEISLNHNDIVQIMKDYFISHQEKGHDINGNKLGWNWFIELCHSLFHLHNHEQYILSKTQNYNTHITTKNGKNYKTKFYNLDLILLNCILI